MYFIYTLYGIKRFFRWWDRSWYIYISVRITCHKEHIPHEMEYKLVFSKVECSSYWLVKWKIHYIHFCKNMISSTGILEGKILRHYSTPHKLLIFFNIKYMYQHCKISQSYIQLTTSGLNVSFLFGNINLRHKIFRHCGIYL